MFKLKKGRSAQTILGIAAGSAATNSVLSVNAANRATDRHKGLVALN